MDEETGAPLVMAQVHLPGLEIGTLSDVDGHYIIRGVPPGGHDVRARLIGYAPKTVTDVVVRGEAVTTLDIALPPRAVEVEELRVTVADERGTTAALLSHRRQASVVTDAIGREQISKSPDSDAAAAMKRVPGVSVVDGRFVYVRGLGERYGSTTLDGARLPSPMPDRKAAPLDLVPASFLESVSTVKSYLPNQSADYAGGLVQIRTRKVPGEDFFKLSVSTGYDSEASLRTGLGYAGGSLDFLGFDDGTRDLPDLIPRDRPVTPAGFAPEELERIGEAFASAWGPVARELPVEQSYGLAFARHLPVGRGLGLFGTLNYANGYSRREGLVERVFASAGAADPEVDYTGSLSIHQVDLGALLNAEYSLSPSSKLEVSTLYNRAVEDHARILEGFNLDSNTDQLNTRLQYVANAIFQTQLSGRHFLSGVGGGSTLRWRGAYSNASRSEPNTREVLYRRAADGRFLWDQFVQSGSVFHQDLDEDGFSGGLDFAVPFRVRGLPASVSVGASASRRDRDVFTRRFRFIPPRGVGSLGDSVRSLAPDRLFAPENISPDSFQIQEATFRPDNYGAAETILAGYAMVEAELLPRIRLAGGVRAERASQDVRTRDLFVEGLEPLEGADLDDTDLIPGVNLTYAVTDRMNLRAAGSRTLARPEFRELAPFSFADFAGGFLVAGNPALERSRITNLDLRWEWFPHPGAVVAASGFYKFFDDPIEVLVFPSTELIKSWVNVEDATNYGAELEVRSDLGFVGHGLRNLSLDANLTLVESDVSTGSEALIFVPGAGPTTIRIVEEERALQGQSPYVLNLGLSLFVPSSGTTATALFNRFGRRIAAVGGQFLDNVFEEPRNDLDLVVEQPLLRVLELRLSAGNILGSEVEFTQFGDLLRGWDPGREVSLSLSWWPGGTR